MRRRGSARGSGAAADADCALMLSSPGRTWDARQGRGSALLRVPRLLAVDCPSLGTTQVPDPGHLSRHPELIQSARLNGGKPPNFGFNHLVGQSQRIWPLVGQKDAESVLAGDRSFDILWTSTAILKYSRKRKTEDFPWPGRHPFSSKSASVSKSTATCRPSSDFSTKQRLIWACGRFMNCPRDVYLLFWA